MRRLKAIIKPFDSGWNYILYTFFKLILLLAIWSWKCNNVMKKKITGLRTSVIRVCWTILNIFPHWISKPCFQKHKNHSKASSSAGRFAQSLCACKKSRYNVQICKSGINNQCHTFRRHKSQYKPTSTNIPHYGLKVKGRKNRKTKPSSPCRRNWMLHAINHCQTTSLWESTRIKPLFPPFDEPNLCNDYIFIDSEYNAWCFLNQVDSNTDMLDNVILQQVVMQPTKKPRSVGPQKSKSKTTTYKKKSYIKNKKFRSVSTQLRRGSEEPNRNGTSLLQQHLFYTNKDPKNYTFIDVGASIPIVTWKLTKNHSHMISDRLFSSCSSYYGSHQRSKYNDKSSSILSHWKIIVYKQYY